MSKERYNHLPVSTTHEPPAGNPARYKHIYPDAKGRDGEPLVTIERKKTLTEQLLPGVLNAAFLPLALAITACYGLIPGLKYEGRTASPSVRLAGVASAGVLIGSIFSKTVKKYALAGWGIVGAIVAVKAIRHEQKYPYTSDQRATNDYYGEPTFTNIKDAAAYRREQMVKEQDSGNIHQEKLAESRAASMETSLRR